MSFCGESPPIANLQNVRTVQNPPSLFKEFRSIWKRADYIEGIISISWNISPDLTAGRLLYFRRIDDLIRRRRSAGSLIYSWTALPLRNWGFRKMNQQKKDGPCIIPADLFKLYVYGYLNRLRTRACWSGNASRTSNSLAIEGLQPQFPDHCRLSVWKTKLFRNAFTHFVRQLNRKGLTGKTLVALDSSKFQGGQPPRKTTTTRKRSTGNWSTSTTRSSRISRNPMPATWMKQNRRLSAKSLKSKGPTAKVQAHRKATCRNGPDQVSTTDPMPAAWSCTGRW